MRTWRTVVAVVLLAAVTQASAQDPVGLTSELERTANTTPQEKVAYAAAASAEITDAVKSIARLLEIAKKDSDVEAIQCLTSRLSAVRALQTVCQNAETAMTSAMSAGETAKADHEFRRVAVALTKARMLLAEAQRCASTQAVASGDTVVDVLLDDDVVDPWGDDPGIDLGDLWEGYPPQVTLYF